MSNFAQFAGGTLGRTPTAIVNAFSSGTPATIPVSISGVSNGAKSTLSGALTAATLTTMLTLTGTGVLHFVGVSTVDATARTLRLQLILDGVTVFDTTSASTSTANYGLVAVGVAANFGTVYFGSLYEAIPYNASAVIKIASSLTESDKLYWHAAYRTI